MSRKPWEEGYSQPEIDLAQRNRERASKAGIASGEAKRKREEALANLPANATPEQIAAATQSKQARRLSKLSEENLSIEKRQLYQDFACEYLRDFNPTNAWIRAGGKPKSAMVRSRQVLRTPYVQKLINTVMDSLEEDNLVTRKQIIMGLWREANDREEGSSGGARVRALMGLARIKKMDVQVVENKGTIQHNVMAVPMTDAGGWAKAAEESQAALKSDVRT